MFPRMVFWICKTSTAIYQNFSPHLESLLPFKTQLQFHLHLCTQLKLTIICNLRDLCINFYYKILNLLTLPFVFFKFILLSFKKLVFQ